MPPATSMLCRIRQSSACQTDDQRHRDLNRHHGHERTSHTVLGEHLEQGAEAGHAQCERALLHGPSTPLPTPAKMLRHAGQHQPDEAMPHSSEVILKPSKSRSVAAAPRDCVAKRWRSWPGSA